MGETRNIRLVYLVFVLQTTSGKLSQKELHTDPVELLKLAFGEQNTSGLSWLRLSGSGLSVYTVWTSLSDTGGIDMSEQFRFTKSDAGTS